MKNNKLIDSFLSSSFLSIGKDKRINPINQYNVCISKCANKNSKTFAKTTNPHPHPIMNVNKNLIASILFFLLIFNLNTSLIDCISLSNIPRMTIIVPPLTPGIMLATPTKTPLIKFFI